MRDRRISQLILVELMVIILCEEYLLRWFWLLIRYLDCSSFTGASHYFFLRIYQSVLKQHPKSDSVLRLHSAAELSVVDRAMDIGQVLTFSTKKGMFQCEVNSKEDIPKDEKGSYKTE